MSALETNRTYGRSWLLIEFALIYVALPVLFACCRRSVGPLVIPILLVVAAGMLFFLLRSRGFDRQRLWHASVLRAAWKPILLRWALGSAVLIALILLFDPDSFLQFPRERRVIWISVMLAYPLFSVYPQEVIFRAFFFHRYAPLFQGRRAMILASAVTFALAHLLFLNWIAITLSFAGGFLFARSYARTDSLAVVSVEHGLWGDTLFTIGLGLYFYGGAIS
jgi:membrane protease YdiL (CAAX protease family)